MKKLSSAFLLAMLITSVPVIAANCDTQNQCNFKIPAYTSVPVVFGQIEKSKHYTCTIESIAKWSNVDFQGAANQGISNLEFFNMNLAESIFELDSTNLNINSGTINFDLTCLPGKMPCDVHIICSSLPHNKHE